MIKPFDIRVNDIIKISDVFGTHTMKIVKHPKRFLGKKEIGVYGKVLKTTCNSNSMVDGKPFVYVGQIKLKIFRNNISKVTKVRA